MNQHLFGALIGALVCAAFLALVLWEIRQYALAKKGVGQPCKHGKAKTKCQRCRPRFGLFSLFGQSAGCDLSVDPDRKPESEPNKSSGPPASGKDDEGGPAS